MVPFPVGLNLKPLILHCHTGRNWIFITSCSWNCQAANAAAGSKLKLPSVESDSRLHLCPLYEFCLLIFPLILLQVPVGFLLLSWNLFFLLILVICWLRRGLMKIFSFYSNFSGRFDCSRFTTKIPVLEWSLQILSRNSTLVTRLIVENFEVMIGLSISSWLCLFCCFCTIAFCHVRSPVLGHSATWTTVSCTLALCLVTAKLFE